MKVRRSKWLSISFMLVLMSALALATESRGGVFTVTDTGQSLCFDSLEVISAPAPGESFHGQDAQYAGPQQSYQDNGDGTVTDLNTGLMWQQEFRGKMTWEEAAAGADTCGTGGYSDWRLPTIKELYSLIQFTGTDPSGPSPVNVIPFIDTGFFEFEYGDTLSGERLIDAQYWSSTVYQGLTMGGDSTAFGVNFADGRIKGYPRDEVGPRGRSFQMTAFVRYVRGAEYGENQFQDNGDGTVTDLATGLMWQQTDDGNGRNWEDALAYAEELNLAGYDDWRLPNAHELQSIVDYKRSMQSTGSPAIDPVFSCTQITDEGGDANYGFYWTGTTHEAAVPFESGEFAVYIAFGEALGWMMTPDSTYVLTDVHGAGAQRSDPKVGDPDQYPHGHGPQGDVVRIYNFVRCVRDAEGTGISQENGGDGMSLEVSGANPSPGQVTLSYSSGCQGTATLEVFDCSGRRMTSICCLPEGILTWSPQCSGTFMARLSCGEDRLTRKFLVIR